MNKVAFVVVIAGVAAVVGPGCIIKPDESSGGYYDSPAPSEVRSCSRHDECKTGCFCDTAAQRCHPSETCLADNDCRAGFRCDGRSSCVPRDEHAAPDGGADSRTSGVDARGESSADAHAGSTPDAHAGGTPDATASCDAAATNGTCAPHCRFDQQCGAGARCLEGRCQRPCTGPTFCGTGDSCRDGFCQPDTQAGGQCVYSPQCSSAGSCINGYCHPGWDRDVDCPNHADVCDRGVCRPDERPLPPCTGNAQCTTGQSCVDGLCRLGCGCDADCAPWGAGTTCAHGFCVAPAELTGLR